MDEECPRPAVPRTRRTRLSTPNEEEPKTTVVERPLREGLLPSDVLSLADGDVRGFWARGAGWVVHLGRSGEATVLSDASVDRFRSVSDDASALQSRGAQRLYGGFAFSPDHQAGGAWEGFPAGRFIAPAVEVEVGLEGGPPVLKVFEGRAGASRADTADYWVRRLNEALSEREGRTAHDRGREIGPRVTGLDPAEWETAILDALATIKDDQASKIVVARTMDLEPSTPVDPVDVVMALWEENKGSHVFLFEPEPGRVLVGAAPETVSTVVDGRFRATAVAGSVGVGTTSVETAALARKLFESKKDRAEQKFVVDHMIQGLESVGCDVHVDVEPHVLTLARIQHLETKIAAEIPDGCSVMDLLQVLHPTPAVCGVPRDAALDWLRDGEPFDRGWYAGPVGWFDHRGRGVFVPALRSAVFNQGRWRLFASCGIVEGSDPTAEWVETGLKFQPMLRALVRAGMSPEVLERAA